MPEKVNKIQNNHGKILMKWSFPEFPKYERTRGWYIGAAIIGGGILIFAMVTGNFLFAIIIVIVAIIIFMRTTSEPARLKARITEDGIEVGTQFYPYKEFKNFRIIYEPPEVKDLYFEFKGSIRPCLAISLEDQNPVKVREILLNFIDEDLSRENESLSDGMGRIFKI